MHYDSDPLPAAEWTQAMVSSPRSAPCYLANPKLTCLGRCRSPLFFSSPLGTALPRNDQEHDALKESWMRDISRQNDGLLLSVVKQVMAAISDMKKDSVENRWHAINPRWKEVKTMVGTEVSTHSLREFLRTEMLRLDVVKDGGVHIFLRHPLFCSMHAAYLGAYDSDGAC